MQMTNDALREMMEMSCMWQWLLPNLKRLLGSGAEFDKIKEAWEMGILDCNKSGPTITICLHVRE